MWCCSTKLTWCRTWMSTWTSTSRTFAKSTPRRRSCRSARAAEPAWVPGSVGCDALQWTPTPETASAIDLHDDLLQATCMTMKFLDPSLGWLTGWATSGMRGEILCRKTVVGEVRGLWNTSILAGKLWTVDNARRRE